MDSAELIEWAQRLSEMCSVKKFKEDLALVIDQLKCLREDEARADAHPDELVRRRQRLQTQLRDIDQEIVRTQPFSHRSVRYLHGALISFRFHEVTERRPRASRRRPHQRPLGIAQDQDR